jgi:hypothetical protein
MAEVALPPAAPSFKAKPILRGELKPWTGRKRAEFVPEQHLAFKEYPETHSMTDIGLSNDVGISPVAVSDPFPLFTRETMHIMRDEVFTKEVFENCMHSTEFAGCQIRGYCPK